MEVLKVSDLSKNFGGVSAVAGFAMEQRENEITGIIGPNGAGKTTLFNLITGVYPVDSGKISFYGTEITRLPSHKITALGITRTFQNIRLFRNLTVLDNVKAAYGVKIHYTVWEEMVRYPTVKKRGEKDRGACNKLPFLLSDWRNILNPSPIIFHTDSREGWNWRGP